jgi:hypothetical protein
MGVVSSTYGKGTSYELNNIQINTNIGLEVETAN